jgi:AraC-like DNA-binding protein
MEDYILFLTLMVAALFALIMFVTSVLLNKNESLYANIYGYANLGWAILLIANALYLTDFYLHFPYLFKITSGVACLVAPLNYLYVRTVLNQSLRLTLTDGLLFFPCFVLNQINRIPFDFLDNAHKIQIIQFVKANPELFLQETEGLLPPNLMSAIRFVFLSSFIIAQSRLLYRWYLKFNEPSRIDIFRANFPIFRWLCVLTGIFLLHLLLILLSLLYKSFLGDFNAFQYSNYLISFGIITAYVYSIINPKILNGMVGWMQEEYPVVTLTETSTNSLSMIERFDRLSPRNAKEILTKVKTHFEKHQSYLTLGYSLSDLSREIKVPSYLISTLINQEFALSFREYINNFRIKELERMIQEDPKFDLLTIEAIGQKLGFKSRTSLVDAIKARTGLTPKEFIQQRRLNA